MRLNKIEMERSAQGGICVKMEKIKVAVAMLFLCIGLCGCQSSREDRPVTPTSQPTEAEVPATEPIAELVTEPTKDVTLTDAPAEVPAVASAIPQAFDETLSSARVVVDGIVYTCDLYVVDGQWYISTKDAENVFGEVSTEKYVSLDAYAQTANIAYEQDCVLNAAYFSTWEPYQIPEANVDFERAFQLELVPKELKERAGEQMSSAEFRELLSDLIVKLAPDKLSYFDEKVTKYDEPMFRGQGFVMAFYAAVCIEANYFNNDYDFEKGTGGDFWDCNPSNFEELLPYTFTEPSYCGWEGDEPQEWGDTLTAAYLWSFQHCSPLSGQMMFTFDEEAGTMNQKGALTVEEAVAVLTRLYDSAVASSQTVYVVTSDSTVTKGFSESLTPELRKKLEEAPEITAENHPVWTGFMFGYAFDRQMYDFTEELKKSANYGFNSARLLLNYEPYFNSEVSEVNLLNLQTLDRMVETAIQYNLHLTISFASIPGREAYNNPTNFTSEGSFDLFINEEKQERVNRMWAILAKRYEEVPSAYLSFIPIWSTESSDLSTGLAAPECNIEECGNYLAEVMEVIREQDEDRLIVYEPTGVNDYGSILERCSVIKNCVKDVGNLIISYNFCENPYVYANMTDVAGENIDNNNRSVFLPEYPTYFYSVGWNVDEEHPITFTGFLPEGTVVDVYLKESWDATLNLSADGEVIFSEYIEKAQFETSNPISRYYQYATSEKKISVTLEKKVDELVLFCTGFGVGISGIDVYLPEEYAVERWYTATTYDVYMGYEEEAGVTKKSTSRIMISPNDYNYLTNIEILEDVSYKTGKVLEEASTETIEKW